MQKIKSDLVQWSVGSYQRISREDGDKEESNSITNQRELIRSFVSGKPDIEIVSEYEDDGYSGVDFERPNFKRMMEDIRAKRVNCVIVKDLSRLGRNYIETGKLLERFFPFMGVRFIAINDGYDSLTHNAQTDSLIIPFKNLINDAYCKDISVKIRSQFEVRRKNGDFIGSFAAYGYQKDPENRNRLVIDENAAPVVRDLFRWKTEGMSQQGIADRLNDLGVLSPLEYKKASGSNYTTVFQQHSTARWTAVAVGRILKNELYTGVLTQGLSTTPNYKVRQRVKKAPEEWVRTEASHEAIISREDFELVARLLKKDTRIAPGENTVYLFSGLLICGDCGAGMVRKTVPGKTRDYVYHVCSEHKNNGGCSSHSISEQALYDAVFETLKLHIGQCVQIGQVLEYLDELPLQQFEAVKLKKQISGKQAEIETLTRRKVKLYEDFSDGIMDREEYITFKAAFTERSEGARRALDRLETELSDIVNNHTEKSVWVAHFQKYHNIESLTRSAVVEMIERITVYEGGRIEVTPRYQSAFENAARYIEALPEQEKAVG